VVSSLPIITNIERNRYNMSAFLGPIHYWLYNKIQLQQDIVDEIYTLGEQYSLSLKDTCDTTYGVFENKPLEEMIDHGNIHGWLQERVSQVEYKYAYCVTNLLKKDPTSFDALRSILYMKGKEVGMTLQGTANTIAEIYKAVSDNLLDGMPCDRANSILAQDEDSIQWKRNVCVHESYWKAVGGNIDNYYVLRDGWLEGLAETFGLDYQRIDPVTYSLRKGEAA